MAHSKNILWADVERTIARNSNQLIQDIVLGESAYQDLLEAFQANGGTDQSFSNKLFNSTANAEQVAMVSDAKAAMVAIHDAYLALDFDALRRMS